MEVHWRNNHTTSAQAAEVRRCGTGWDGMEYSNHSRDMRMGIGMGNGNGMAGEAQARIRT